MENDQNAKVNFKTSIINTELSEKLAIIKLNSLFLMDSLAHCYQTRYSTKNYVKEELDIIEFRYHQITSIMDNAISLFKKELDNRNIDQ